MNERSPRNMRLEARGWRRRVEIQLYSTLDRGGMIVRLLFCSSPLSKSAVQITNLESCAYVQYAILIDKSDYNRRYSA
jgi:hypothetical protein